MAKRADMSRGSVPASVVPDDVPAEFVSEILAKPEIVTIEIPVSAEPLPTAFNLHIDTRLSAEQSAVLRRVARKLDEQNVTLASGKRAVHPTDAVKYLLEIISAASLEQQTIP
jgi:hypothetical protein